MRGMPMVSSTQQSVRLGSACLPTRIAGAAGAVCIKANAVSLFAAAATFHMTNVLTGALNGRTIA
jgi:hypothetical protein